MAKRKRGRSYEQTQAESQFDSTNNKLTINSYEDVPDSEDEFHSHRDKILLDEPESKRRRQIEQQDFLELSDEEVLGYSNDESDDDDAHDVDAPASESDDPGRGEVEDVDSDPDNWGTSKADYYGGDINETEEDALREEEAAREAQQRRLKNLKEADFGFDENEWRDMGPQDDPDKEGRVITEVLPELRITDDMSEESRTEILQTRYPEFEALAKEFVELQDAYSDLNVAARDCRIKTLKTATEALQILQWRALSAYLGCLASYFAFFTSRTPKDGTKGLPLPPHELHDHELMDSLVQCRELWAVVKNLDVSDLNEAEVSRIEKPETLPIPEMNTGAATVDPTTLVKSKTTASDTFSTDERNTNPSIAASESRRAARLRNTEASLAHLTKQLRKSSKPLSVQHQSRHANGVAHSAEDEDVASDIGDEDPLPADIAAEKARKRKSLRFYTSQIQQKANKRETARAARAGGDEDVPRRERLRDRQERLNQEAERRGRQSQANTNLDGNDAIEEEAITNREREAHSKVEFGEDLGDDEYSSMVAAAQAKKDQKARREQAYTDAKASNSHVVVQKSDQVGPSGRREVGYAIEKNKGLMPRRKKEVKNPRVKKRMRYEDKKKKLRSMKPVFKGGEGKGGYGGELTGIKKGLVKSTKL